jgi:hypothetical protein
MPEFGGMQKFNPQVRPLNIAGQRPSLAGSSIKGEGNVRVMAPWNPQEQGQEGQQQIVPAQLGEMNTPRGAQPIQLAQAGRPVYAQPAPAHQHSLEGPEEQKHFSIEAKGRDGRVFTAQASVGFPAQTRVVGYLPPQAPTYQMGGQEETHVFQIRGITPDNREVLRSIDVIFPAGVGQPILSAMNE